MLLALKNVVHHHLEVGGEFVNPKNITNGLNKPSGVRKAAFHSSPSLIQMLLYPHHMLNLVNKVHPASRSTTCGINEDTFRFFFVHLLTGPIVLYWTKFAIFLSNKEDICGIGSYSWSYSSSFQVFSHYL